MSIEFKLNSARAQIIAKGGRQWKTLVKKASQRTGAVLMKMLTAEYDRSVDTQPTGAGRRGITTSAKEDQGGFTVLVGWLVGSGGRPTPHYIGQLNYGGLIPRSGNMPPGRFLVFEWRGKTVFAKRVWQPGRHFIEPVRESAEEVGTREMDKAITDELRRLTSASGVGA